jgi:hypothetical protein
LCDSILRRNGVLDLPAVRSTNIVVAIANINNKLIRGNGELALAVHNHFVLGELKE